MSAPEQPTLSNPHPGSGLLPALSAADAESHLLDRLSILYRHRRLAVTVLLLVFIGAAVHTYTTVPVYRAQARLLIQDERSVAIATFNANDPTFWEDPEPYYQTQYRILQSRGLGRRVVHRLDLANVAEFNGTGPRTPNVASFIASARSLLWGPIRSYFTPPPETELPAPDERPGESALIGAFLSRVRVEPVRNTRLVDVSFVSVQPAFAARAVNALAEEYVEQNLELRLNSVDKSLAWLREETARQQAKLQTSERALAEYREQKDALSLEDRQNIVVSRLNQLNDAVTRAKTLRAQKEAVYRQVEAAGRSGQTSDGMPSILSTAAIQHLNGRLLELEREKARLSERYGEKHPEMVAVTAGLQDVRRQIREEIAKAAEGVRNEYEMALQEERTLSAALEAQKRAALELDRKSVDYTILAREAASNRQVYEQLLQREKELQVISNSRANNVQLIDRAEEPASPFTPNPRRSLMLGLVLGLALAIGLVFAVDYMDDTIKTPEDIARRIGAPFLGLVPAVRGTASPVLSGSVPHEFSEAYRALRTSIVFTSGADPARILVVTSAQPFEGKTTTAGNLGLVLAAGGARVLLVEADMRRPSLHRAFGLENPRGLSELLSGQIRVRDAIQPTASANLFILPGGQVPPNPSELLASDRMKTLLGTLASGPFDWVILDTPPVLAVTDAVVLAPAATAVVFVLGAGMTSRRHAEQAFATLMTAQPRAVGVVLNRVDFNRDKYYYSRYYGYQYKSYYGTAA